MNGIPRSPSVSNFTHFVYVVNTGFPLLDVAICAAQGIYVTVIIILKSLLTLLVFVL
jgi:hypothetical protein